MKYCFTYMDILSAKRADLETWQSTCFMWGVIKHGRGECVWSSVLCCWSIFHYRHWMLEMTRGLSVQFMSSLAETEQDCWLSKPVQQYEFIKFTVVLREDLFGQNRILKHLYLLYYYGFVHWTFFIWAVKKGNVHKTPFQHGRIPRKPSKVQCQPY